MSIVDPTYRANGYWKKQKPETKQQRRTRERKMQASRLSSRAREIIARTRKAMGARR